MTIGEFSKATGISESTLRYYEKKNLIRVGRNVNGRRIYDKSDIEWIRFIKRLKDTGMLLKDIQRYADFRYLGDSTLKERLEILKTHHPYVLEEQKKWCDYLNNLNKKINFYEEKIASLEKSKNDIN
ncbi:MerR family transcriptional regulator [Anaerosacchariphilus polymeriproducens]|uniref:MerR family transcriptional regulator n=1 Tax=Anaerosacchariphilus polymeriproducens TaxID=1812858 RepID=A0A371B091_9FIRM|nr:MerR family transcriptional regulator [Anaerosacchariphilus polymeriproducens]RDU25219.1 MerR family transcriptional regulator [Anaerosacchariphilus polymeriproducens]